MQSTFYPPTSAPQPTATKSTATSLPASATTVDVYNGGGTPGLAGQLSQALTSAGFKAGKVGNIASQSSTRVLYGTGAGASAAKIAGHFGGVTAAAGGPVAAGHVEVLLGTDATAVPAGIGSAASSGSPASSPSRFPVRQSHTGVEQRPGGGVREREVRHSLRVLTPSRTRRGVAKLTDAPLKEGLLRLR